VHSFGPRGREQARAGVRALARRIRSAADEQAGGHAHASASASAARSEQGRGAQAEQTNAASGDAFARDDACAAAALERFDPGAGPIVAYVGKLIVSKGVDLLLAAWPLVLQRVPDAQLAIVGFGALQQSLEGLTRDLATGRIDAVRDFANAGRALEGGPRAPLTHLCAFLDGLETDRRVAGPERAVGPERDDGPGHGDGHGRGPYLSAAAGLAERVVFTGRLEHEELADLLPACEAIVVPSTFPEAFGMVAVEAAACGLLPISAAHSGLAEVSRALAAAVPEQAAPWLSFPVDAEVVDAIAQRLISWLAAEEGVRARTREALVSTVRRLWSWEGVATGVISAAEGDVEALPAP
jgi:glycosyltransferase involved in cell wall biosynthesis